MEPGEQNAYLFAFYYYDNPKLTKKQQQITRSVQIQWSNSQKKRFFSVPRLFLKNFLQSLRELHCWIADRLKYTNPGEQN